MKRYISIIIAIIISLNISYFPALASSNNSIEWPEDGNELGYLFVLSDESPLIDTEEYPNIKVANRFAKVYFAYSLSDIKAISQLYSIKKVEKNTPLQEEPDTINNINDSVVLFSEDNIATEEPDATIAPVISEGPSESNVPENTEIPIKTEEPIGTEEPLETATPEHEHIPDQETTPNDPLYPYQWSHEAVNIKAYWEHKITGEGVKVGIIDTGINREHSAFEGVNIETGINVCAVIDNNEEKLYDTTDEDGHGTTVTSIICSTVNDSIGMAGLTDKVTIVPYRLKDNDFSYTANSAYAIVKGIELATIDKCDILNISQGCISPSQTEIEIFNSVVDAAAEKGIIVIAAAGNCGQSGNPNEYPASCTNTISVGAIEPDGCDTIEIIRNEESGEILGPADDVINTFVNGYSETYGLYLSDISGTFVYSADTVSKLPKNSFKKMNMSTANESVYISAPGNKMFVASGRDNNRCFTSGGTSLATPFVVAAVAGIKQMRPYVDTDMVKEILKATSVDLDEEGYDINTGYGMVDFEAIYNYVLEMPEAISEETPEIQIDYANNMLTGFVEDAEYLLNGVSVTPEEGSTTLDDSWYGSTISVVRKSRGNGYSESEAQELNVPAIPDAPTGVSTGYNKIIGTTTDMEYKSSASDTWISCLESKISDLEAGTYDVRLKASETAFASKITQIQVENAPQAEDTPNIAIDYKNHVLTGFEDGSEYVVNENTVAIANGKLNIVEAWYGNSISIVKKSRGDGYIDSEAQELSIPTIPDAPTTVSAGYNKITSVKTTMEYKLSSSDTWISCSGTEIANLDAGSYDVRIKATTTSFASNSVQVDVFDLPIQPTTPPLEKEYTIETSVNYDETNNRVVFSTTNNTDNTIYATGIVAVYDTNGILKYIKTVKTFPKGTLNQSFAYNNSNCKIKFFIWKDMQSLQPYPDVKCSEWVGENNG